MMRHGRGAGGEPRRLSRRATLRAAAGLTASTLTAAGLLPATSAAQEATSATSVAPRVLPDLRGVIPLPLSGERLATFEAEVAAKLAAAAIPGAAVAVIQDGETAFLQGFGVRELGRPEPVTPDTLLRIGSVTKSFSSLLVATLVDAGRLRWETPLVELLPDFAVADADLTRQLTVRDAFCACTGLPRRDLEFQFRAQELTPEAMLASMAGLPLTAPFGQKFQYNNQMVATGGFAAAVADGGSPTDLGRAYAIALREQVLNPLGMSRTTLSLAEVAASNDYAAPHAADIAGTLQPLPLLDDDTWIVPVGPTGALWSSAREMARYVQTELTRGVSPDGVRVVSAENLERTWQPGVAQHLEPGAAPEFVELFGHYGLGWFVGAYGGQRVVWHTGFTLGFSSIVAFLPEADLGLVVLTNCSGSAYELVFTVMLRLLELLFEQPAAVDAIFTSALTASARQRADLVAQLGQVDAAEVRPFPGRYVNADLGELTLALRGGALVLTVGGFRSDLRSLMDGSPTTAYVPVDAPFGSGLSPMTIGLQRGADGEPQVTMTIHDDDGGELTYRYELAEAAATPAPPA